jgi:hypothetical protein
MRINSNTKYLNFFLDMEKMIYAEKSKSYSFKPEARNNLNGYFILKSN